MAYESGMWGKFTLIRKCGEYEKGREKGKDDGEQKLGSINNWGYGEVIGLMGKCRGRVQRGK